MTSEIAIRLIFLLIFGLWALHIAITGHYRGRGLELRGRSARFVALMIVTFACTMASLPVSALESPIGMVIVIMALTSVAMVVLGLRLLFERRPAPSPPRRVEKYAHHIEVALTHAANAGIIAYLNRPFIQAAPSASPTGVDPWRLGTHPDLVEIVWDQLPGQLPESCQWLVYGRPALVHPHSGVIFGIATGTSVLALRLPESKCREVRMVESQVVQYSDGSRLLAGDLGDDWTFIPFNIGAREREWCVHAYEYAGSMAR
jgi:hypothetical protein